MSGGDTATGRMIAHLQDVAGRVAAGGGDIEAIRRVMEDYSRLDAATRRTEARAVPVAAPAGEWVVAENSAPDRRLLYLHGGSWMSGSPDGYRPMAGRIARATGYSVFVADYRLAPEHPFPAGLEDCVRACRWMRDHGPDATSRAMDVVVAGDSAGGNLALATFLKLKDQADDPPRALVVLSPATDLTWGSPSLRTRAEVDPILRPDRLSLVSEAYVQGGERMDHPYVSPLFGDFSGLSSMLIQVGDREILMDDAKRLADTAGEQGVDVALQVYENMPHVFQLFAPTVSAADEAIQKIGVFVRSSLRTPAGDNA